MQWAVVPRGQPWIRGAVAAAALLNGSSLVRAAARIPGSRFNKDVVRSAIDGSMGITGLGLLLAALAA